MINITKLYCGISQPADHLRYGIGEGAPASASGRRPVVVWNITRRCNLNCIHCYSDSSARHFPGELDSDQCRAVIDDLADFGVPGLLFSGGEPLIHPQFFAIAKHARELGLRLTLSTNGTLIDRGKAEKIKALGLAYVGISLDGIGATHDQFRGKAGAFDRTIQAFHHCKAVGQKVGLRLTLSAHNIADLDGILDFIEAQEIERVCFYHLVYSGRGSGVVDVTHQDTRLALDKIIDRAARWADAGTPREVLTVDQPADGAYVYNRLRREDPERAAAALDLLLWNGGGRNASGIGLANIDTQGDVHPDQFWQSLTLGNVKQQKFSKIWTGSKNPILAELRDPGHHPSGKCADCQFLPICGGGFRVRSLQVHGDVWAPDPACYLTESECCDGEPIGLAG